MKISYSYRGYIGILYPFSKFRACLCCSERSGCELRNRDFVPRLRVGELDA